MKGNKHRRAQARDMKYLGGWTVERPERENEVRWGNGKRDLDLTDGTRHGTMSGPHKENE